MIHFSNLFVIYVQGDGMIRIDFKAGDPMNMKDPETVSSIYFIRTDAVALANTLSELLARPVEPGKTVTLN